MRFLQLLCSKSGLRAAFSCLLWTLASSLVLTPAHAQATPYGASVPAWLARASTLHLHESDTWWALLHIQDGEPQIRSTSFLLSLDDFSPQHELEATLAYLFGSASQEAVCRYPARYAWLQHELNLPPLSLQHCAEFQEFLQRAPADNMSLVFASENLSQPSSMMGHLFLKVSGVQSDGRTVEHAISFYTDTATLNLPKMLYDSIVVGMPGYFTLTPYQSEVNKYVGDEQRTLWEYGLRLSDERRRLIQYHMQELRHVDITYYFQRYNCATLVKHLLAVGEPELLRQGAWWVTPKSVLSMANDSHMLSSTSVKTPARWMIRNLRPLMPADQSREVGHAVESGNLRALDALSQADAPHAFEAIELARNYNDYLFSTERQTRQTWQQLARHAQTIEQTRFTELSLQADQSKNPVNAPRDKQWSIGWQQQDGRDQLKLGLLPISHTLTDDNSPYFSENELRLFDSAVLIDRQSGKVALDHFTVYGVTSLLPWDEWTGGVSGQFKLGFESQPYTATQDKTALLIEGAFGGTLRLGNDVDAFALLGGGWGYRHDGYLYAKPTVGLLVREVFNMKSIVTLSRTSHPLGEAGNATALGLTQSKLIDARNTIILEAQRTWRSGQAANKATLTYKHLF
jgi:hypothetical protein